MSDTGDGPAGDGPADQFTQPDQESGPRVEFYGGRGMSAFPIAFFIVWAIVQTALWRIGDTGGLIVGILVGLIVGMFFVRGTGSPTPTRSSRE